MKTKHQKLQRKLHQLKDIAQMADPFGMRTRSTKRKRHGTPGAFGKRRKGLLKVKKTTWGFEPMGEKHVVKKLLRRNGNQLRLNTGQIINSTEK